MVRVYKILTAAAWAAAGRDGLVPLSPADEADGFVHLSDASQIAGTLAAHFSDAGDLVLAAFDGDALGPALRWEASRGGALFPHYFGRLEARQALSATPLRRRADGGYDLP